jgi:hypothetical protein
MHPPRGFSDMTTIRASLSDFPAEYVPSSNVSMHLNYSDLEGPYLQSFPVQSDIFLFLFLFLQ